MTVTGTHRYTCQQAARYGHAALPGAAKKKPVLRFRPCQECEQLHERNSQYCSNACKQAAYRRRRDPGTGLRSRRQQRSDNAARTKAWIQRRLVCEHCEREFTISLAESTNRRYCSNACKQAAYRERKKAECQTS